MAAHIDSQMEVDHAFEAAPLQTPAIRAEEHKEEIWQGDISRFPLRNRIRHLLADFNIIFNDSRRPEFINEQQFQILSSYAFATSETELSSTSTTVGDVLRTLSELAAVPGCAFFLVKNVQPLVIDIFARWLLLQDGTAKSEEQWERELFILTEVAEFVPELWNVLNTFLSQSPYLSSSPLASLSTTDSILSIPPIRLQLLLLSQFRLLYSDPRMSVRNYWTKVQLQILYERHADQGVRYLAIQCWILVSGLAEQDRRKLEAKWLEPRSDHVSALIAYGWKFVTIEQGKSVGRMELETIEGFGLRLKEALREKSFVDLGPATRVMQGDDNNETNVFSPTDFSPFSTVIGGHLTLRYQSPPPVSSAAIPQSTNVEIGSQRKAIRTLTQLLERRLPILLTGMASAGKTHLLRHMSSTIYPTTPVNSKILTISLADTSIDAKALLGSYVTSPTEPGTFTWVEGALSKAIRGGRWIILEDIDRAGQEVLSLFARIADSLGPAKAVGARALLDIPGRPSIEAGDGFAIFATRKVNTTEYSIPATFLGHNYFAEVILPSPSESEVQDIMNIKYPKLAGPPVQALSQAYQKIKDAEAKHAKVSVPGSGARRTFGLRDLEKWCARVENALVATGSTDIAMHVDHSDAGVMRFSNPSVQDEIFLEAVDIFLGSFPYQLAAQAERRQTIARILGEALGLGQERSDWLLDKRVPQVEVSGDSRARQSSTVRVGRASLHGLAPRPHVMGHETPSRPYAMTKPSAILLERVAVGLSLNEPMLLVGETGTGKTTAVQHIASILNRPLTVINLSTQTESADLLGGFKPIDAAVPARHLYIKWLELFRRSFSFKQNEKYSIMVRDAIEKQKWERVVEMWRGAARKAEGAAAKKRADSEGEPKRKRRRKADDGSPSTSAEIAGTSKTEILMQDWAALLEEIDSFELQYVKARGKLVFAFVEGPLVQALRCGEWILLDEVNLASQETLESLSTIIENADSSLVLTERGDLEPIKRHPDFRLFACMNPATDVGKKDLPPSLRMRFTEIYSPPPDDDNEALVVIVKQYLGDAVAADRSAILDVAEFYMAMKNLCRLREIVDGTNVPPHFSMRTLARALTFAVDVAPTFGLRRGLYEGCLMTFTMSLNETSMKRAQELCDKHLLNGIRNPKAIMRQQPSVPGGRDQDEFVRFGHYWLQRGPEKINTDQSYVITPSVQKKLSDLARIVLTGKYPVLIQGPTSAGKTSAVEYLAKQTGHKFVRINNHEHTDIQEYLGTYTSDPKTGKLAFREGLLVTAVRRGDWLVLDELNLAPTDVLEALNRLLDDNRELIIPETGEVVRPHPHFMLFATQNPPGLYAGRKVLSRAFRNRFLEVHFEDVPQDELQTILCQRCVIAPSYAQKIVQVFQELQHFRQSTRMFESKDSYATLRDLFRWASREVGSYQELAETGYMLLAERARKEEDRAIVKQVIETTLKVTVNPTSLYTVSSDLSSGYGRLKWALPQKSSNRVVWTTAMQRLYTLVATATRYNEPVLLIGETGAGKTSVCEVLAEVLGRPMFSISCHQNMETADILGSQRPIRDRSARLVATHLRLKAFVEEVLGGYLEAPGRLSADWLLEQAEKFEKTAQAANMTEDLASIKMDASQCEALFEWHDGPLVHAMQQGGVLLLDELSLADDSVLERLNSVLEPSKTLVLAEKGGSEADVVTGNNGFQIVATMNPGGDFGKKELSPALRNRFTEIWVPAITDYDDLYQIMSHSWKSDALQQCSAPVIDFFRWLNDDVLDHSQSGIGLRDLLAWITFSNHCYMTLKMPLSVIFEHAARLIVVDGLELLPGLAGLGRDWIHQTRMDALAKVKALTAGLAGNDASSTQNTRYEVVSDTKNFGIGPFILSKGTEPNDPNALPFAMQAPTTLENLVRVLRACQLPKSILLEGSPGVGKTTLVQALADASGRALCRINLSEQTDLIDLFGSDLPVVGGQAGEFAWQDASFLTAMRNGHWVLLDEMNLASQAILEGLNAVLDHRGSVFIPELGKTFDKHPDFRIFAAQNPVQQGGGRKGLPKSFLNRFTKVYIQEHERTDLQIICGHLYPDVPSAIVNGIIDFNQRLQRATMVDRVFGYEGSPWEFNLRDIIRCFRLILAPTGIESVSPLYDAINTVYIKRFRNKRDQQAVAKMLQDEFAFTIDIDQRPWPSVSSETLQVGHVLYPRKSCPLWNTRRLESLPETLQAQEALLRAVSAGWLTILVGPASSGKRSLVRHTAHLAGASLSDYSMHPAVDTMEMLGSFEQSDKLRHLAQFFTQLLSEVRPVIEQHSAEDYILDRHLAMIKRFIDTPSHTAPDAPIESAKALLSLCSESLGDHRIEALTTELATFSQSSTASTFEWVDGPLVTAIKSGGWYLINDANLCSSSVLDRLNSLCELNGSLILSERGSSEEGAETIAPHPDFRLFMAFDPRNGELSRAMRNRGVEVAMVEQHLPVLQSSNEDILCPSSWLPAAYVTDSHIDANSVLRCTRTDFKEQTRLDATHTGRFVASYASIDLPDVFVLLRTLFGEQSLLVDEVIDYIRDQHDAALKAYVQKQVVQSFPKWSDLDPSIFPMDLSVNPTFAHLEVQRLVSRYLTLLVECVKAPHIENIGSETTLLVQKFLEVSTRAILDAARRIFTGDPTDSANALAQYSLLSDVVKIVAQSLERSTTFDVGLIHVLLNQLRLKFSGLKDLPNLSNVLQAIGQQTTPTVGLAQSSLWSSMHRSTKFDLAVDKLKFTLSQHALVWDTLGLETVTAVAMLLFTSTKSSPEDMDRMLDAWNDLPVSKGIVPTAMITDQLTVAGWSVLRSAFVQYDEPRAESFKTFTSLLSKCGLLEISPVLSIAFLQSRGRIDSFTLNSQAVWFALEQSLASLFQNQTSALATMRPVNLQSALSLNITKATRMGELPVNSQEYQHNLALFKFDIQKGSVISSRTQSIDLGLVFVLKTLISACGPSDPAFILHPDELGSILNTTASYRNRITCLEICVGRHPVPAVRDAFARYFGSREQGEEDVEEFTAGRLWLRAACLLNELYIPDVPLDPAIEQYCHNQLKRCEAERLEAELDIAQVEQELVLGVSDGLIVRQLKKAIADLPRVTEDTREEYGSRLQAVSSFYQETHRFFAHVHLTSKLLEMESRAITLSAEALQEADNFQIASQSYLSRLKTTYASLKDLTLPIQVGIQAAKYGILMTTDAARRKIASINHANIIETVDTVASFPSAPYMSSLVHLQNTMGSNISATSASQVLLALEAASAIKAAGGEIDSLVTAVNRSYQILLALWLADEKTALRSEQVGESLYRERKTDHDAIPDAEREAQELLAMFPQFESWEAQEDEASEENLQNNTLLNRDYIVRAYSIHLELFDSQLRDVHSFDRATATTLMTCLKTHPDMFSDALDPRALLSRLSILAQRHTQEADPSQADSYNFYLSENIPQMKKVLDLLARMQVHLNAVLEEFPDQMVIQHLLDRCDNIRSITATSPVARMLSALEQLLTHTEDWQAYANKSNSLAAFQEEIIQLIISWRRLELLGWSRLLDQEAESYRSETADWWFRMYQLLIMGTADESDEELSGYIAKTIPLLFDFLESSTLGRFSSRLQLLRSFQTLIRRSPELRSRVVLQKAARMLESILCRFGQFESRVNDSIVQQRQPLDKAISDFVKLATWKDVNIEAMRASARKTHAHLYKSIHKFRDVLKQPISLVLQQELPTVADQQDDATCPISVTQKSCTLTVDSREDISGPLLNLAATHEKFKTVMQDKVVLESLGESSVQLNDLAIEIVDTVAALQQETPNSLTEENKKAVGNLQSRKRKAFSELLKALRDFGFSAKLRADQMGRQTSVEWLCDLEGLFEHKTSYPAEVSRILQEVESYHHRFDLMLPAMRESLRNHNEDFVTQDLQRAHGFAENIFSHCLKQRIQLVTYLKETAALDRVVHRMDMLSQGGKLYAVNSQFSAWSRSLSCALANCVSSLDEGCRRLQDISSLSASSEADSVRQAVLALSNEARTHHETIAAITEQMALTTLSIITESEIERLKDSQRFFEHTNQELQSIARTSPTVALVILPLAEMAATQSIDADLPLLTSQSNNDLWNLTDAVIEDLLLSAQRHVKLAQVSDAKASDGARQIMEMDNVLNQVRQTYRPNAILGKIQELHSAVLQNSSTPEDLSQVITRSLPFLHEHLAACHSSLWTVSRNLKSLYKLDYILIRLFRTLADKGFCKPAETSDDDSKGGEGQQVEGMGLGAGTGDNNVSNEIEDEGQVEGLKDEDQGQEEDSGEKREKEQEAIEMGDDFEGALSDVDGDDEDDEGNEQDEEDDGMDEHVGDVDPEAVDDKFWGDENNEEDEGTDDKTDRKDGNSGENSEMAAKEEEQQKSGKDASPKPDEADAEESPVEEDGQEQIDEGEAEDDGGQDDQRQDDQSKDVDANVAEADILDLPEGMDLDQDQDDGDLGDEEGDVASEVEDEQGSQADADEENEESADNANTAGSELDDADMEEPEHIDAHPDETEAHEQGETEQGAGENGQGESGADAAPEKNGTAATENPETEDKATENTSETMNAEQSSNLPEFGQSTSAEDNSELANQGGEVAQPTSNNDPQDHSLGDKFQDIHRMINEILQRSEDDSRVQNQDAQEQGPKQVEHVREDEDSEMQALGAAGAEDHEKLADLAIVDEEADDQAGDHAMEDDDEAADSDQRGPQKPQQMPNLQNHSAKPDKQEDKALTRSQINKGDVDMDEEGEDAAAGDPDQAEPEPTDLQGQVQNQQPENGDVELALQEWVASGRDEKAGQDLWRQYSSLTSDLSYHLCEQLRLILQPTLATRLQGDYRTGKRLNMRKIIPYIASEYTKDKIWLRRTKPSRREYQVLLSLDDSRSMADTKSVHLAYQTLALVSQALTKLEVGQIGIARFGETVDMLHDFDGNAFSDAEGSRIMNTFTFQQHRTDVARLVGNSLDVLANARRAQSSSTSGDLWQLEIIISDGVCQDHAQLRRLLRRALQERVMIVFLVIDSLAPPPPPPPAAPTTSTAPPPIASTRPSILNMQTVAYKQVNGEMKIEMERYLDTFPFEYYVVLRDVEALPEVLSETLRQWIARVSMSEE